MTTHPQQPKHPDFHMLRELDRKMETPLLWLSFLWLFVLVAELLKGFTPFIFVLGTCLWITFVFQFLVKFFLAISKWQFLKSYWLLTLALAIPILRLLNIQDQIPWIKYVTATSGAQLIWVFCSINHSMRAIRESMQRRGFSYVLLTTAVAIFVSAAGIAYFESGYEQSNITGYGEALWWTGMQMTNIGSAYDPISTEGQIIALALSVYACVTVGYLTATLATYFVGKDAEDPKANIAGEKSVEILGSEIAKLRNDVLMLKELMLQQQITKSNINKEGGS